MTCEISVSLLSKKISQIERSMQFWKSCTILLLVIFCSLSIAGFASPPSKTLQAESFKIIDHNGVVRMELTTNQNGPLIAQYDEMSNLRLLVDTNNAGSTINFLDDNLISRMVMRTGKSGSQLSQFASDGTKRTWIATMPGNNEIALADSNGDLRTRIDSDENGTGFAQYDAGNLKLHMLSSDGKSGVVLYDKYETARLIIALNKNGPAINKKDKYGNSMP